MPIYDRMADVQKEDTDEIANLVNSLAQSVNRPVDHQVELVRRLDEYVPVLLLNVQSHAFSVCTVANYQTDGVAFLVMAGPVNAFGHIVFVPQPHAAGVVQMGRQNLEAFLSGAYVWKKT
jgi:hypothetical protein